MQIRVELYFSTFNKVYSKIKLYLSNYVIKVNLISNLFPGWTAHDAMKIVKAVSHLDVYIEQPCVSYRECQSIRAHTNLPFVLDDKLVFWGDIFTFLPFFSTDWEF